MDKALLSVLNMSLTAGYVILAICVARFFLRKAPRWVVYSLWGVAGFRFVFPFSLESVFSLLPFDAEIIPSNAAPENSTLRILLRGGSCIWLAGVAAMLIYSVVSVVLLKKRLQNARLTIDGVYEDDSLKTPFVLGFYNPKIYIPAGLTSEEKSCVILHERTHIHRLDHVVKQVAYLILCAHWFNPLAWLGFLLMSVDMELSCDERVLKELGGDIKKAYSSSLLSLAAGRRFINGVPLAFGEGGIKTRVANILNFKKPARLAVGISATVVAVLSLGFAVNPIKPQQNTLDFYNFQVNGMQLGAPVYVDAMAMMSETPEMSAVSLNTASGYYSDGAHFSVDDKTERLSSINISVDENGVYIPKIIVNGEILIIPGRLETIEQVTSFFGTGESGWSDWSQGLRYMRYRDKRGFESIEITFVYENRVLDMGHSLVRVEAETGLTYPDELDFRLFVWKEDGDPRYTLFCGTAKPLMEQIFRMPYTYTSLDELNSALSANVSILSKQPDSLRMAIFPMDNDQFTEDELTDMTLQLKQGFNIEVGRRANVTPYGYDNRISWV